MKRYPYGQLLGLFTPSSNNSSNYFFTSLKSKMDCLYSPLLGKGESTSNCISCSNFLLGGIPFEDLNTYMYDCEISYK